MVTILQLPDAMAASSFRQATPSGSESESESESESGSESESESGSESGSESESGECVAALRRRLWLGAGAHMDSDELLAVLVGRGRTVADPMGLARDLLDHCGGLGGLSRAPPQEMAEVFGVGESTAVRVVAAFEIARRAWRWRRAQVDVLSSSEDVYRYVGPRLSHQGQEAFWVIAIDTRNRVVGEFEISRGTVSEVTVHPRDVFRPLVRIGAYSAIAVHNHPSGDATPSAHDVAVTYRLREVGALVGIPIIDHVVIGSGDFASINDWVAQTKQ